MTTIQDQYQFAAEVKTKSKQQNRDGWAMTVDWKLPGSRFDLTLYGQDWEMVENVSIDERGQGPTCEFVIERGNLKTGKNGLYSSDFFWNMVSIDDVIAPPKPKPDELPPGRDHFPKDKPPPDLPPNPAALGSCHNHAVEFITAGILPVPMGRELIGWIHELRDRFYREVNQAPVMPLHYCYEHDQERRKSKTGNWGHILPKQADDEEDAYCVEHREGWRVFDASQR